MRKPELGPVKVGDTLLVITTGRRKGDGPREAIVTKAARVWIDMVPADGSSWPVWRMRRDTQTDGGAAGSPTRFVTAEQHAWEQAEHQADEFLREAGIELRWGMSRYWTDKVTLANIIRKHEGLPEL